MKILKILVAAVFLLAAGSAVAGKGGPIIAGVWAGSGQAMYLDGTPAIIVSVSVVLYQEGNFFYGLAEFEVTVGEDEQPTQFGQLSGHISGNAVKGVMGGCEGPAPACFGAATFDGKLSGNKLRGTFVDLSDGSTAVLTLHRLAD